MPLYTDQLNRVVKVSSLPDRIISLVPSQTELLWHLGLEREVLGITKFCIHPEKWFRQKERIGGTKNINLKKIFQLQPNLIIANKEENVQAQIEELANHFPVWVSDVNNLADAYKMIEGIGEITGKKEAAEDLTSNIKIAFAQLQPPNTKPRTAYLIWKEPYMTVGGDTFIHHLMEKAGFENVFAKDQRYPQINVDELQAAGCQFVLLSSEPYPFKQKHIDELQQHLPHIKVMLVDGEMFSWYSSRLLKAPSYFQSLQKQIAALP